MEYATYKPNNIHASKVSRKFMRSLRRSLSGFIRDLKAFQEAADVFFFLDFDKVYENSTP